MSKLKIFSKELINKYLHVILPLLLLLAETLIIVEYFIRYTAGTATLVGGIALIVACVALIVLQVFDAFVFKKLIAKIFVYTADSLLLLAVCIFAGNSFLSVLYCIVLTQVYLAGRFKVNCIYFAASCVTFIGSFVGGWLIANLDKSIAESFIEILSGCIFGLIIIIGHFAITNFIIRFFRINAQLKQALKEADEGRTRLEEAQDKLAETAVYEERNRIAKDIHDNAGHSMTTVIIQTEAAKLLIDTNPEEAKNAIISANIQAKNALEKMRESVHLLAGRDENHTLREEIAEIAAQTMDGTNLKIRMDLDEVEVPDEVHRFLCNCIKECLSNGLRHGGATAFYIELKGENGITLLVSDNGGGLKENFKEGFGLKGMREGAENLGGSLVINSEEGDGVEVRVSIPDKEVNGND